VEGSARRFGLLVVIDSSKIDIRVGCLKLSHLAVKFILLELSSELTVEGFVLGQCLVLFDERLRKAAQFLKALAAGKLLVHIALEVSQLLSGVSDSLNLLDSLSSVPGRRHKVAHVHR